MKRLLAMLLLLSLSVLIGCSESSEIDTPQPETPEASESIENDKFQGVHGTYEWIETVKMKNDDKYIGIEHSHLYHIIRYTNTTNQAVIPAEAIREEMELQQETEIELNTLGLQAMFVHENNDDWVNENLEIVKNNYRNIKPGATVDFAMETIADKELIDSVYLRNRIKTPTDKVIFEKKITISTP